MPESSLPLPAVRRLPQYLRFLRSLQSRERDVVSCRHISDALGVDPTLVRKDIAITGITGRPKVGYGVPELVEAIEQFLGWHNTTDAVLIGAGNLGRALLGYRGFQSTGLNIVAGFDTNPDVIGKSFVGKEIFHLDAMPDLIERLHIHIGILTVPPESAQETCNAMILAGLRGIWNFTPVALEAPPTVVVETVNLASSLAVLSSRLSALMAQE